VAVVELDGGHGVDGAGEDRTVAKLEFLGLVLRNLETVGDIRCKALTTDGDDICMGESPSVERRDISRAAAHIEEDDAGFAVGVEQAGFGRCQRLEHDPRNLDTTVLDGAQEVLDAGDRPANNVSAHGYLAGGEACGILDALGPIEDVAPRDDMYHPLVLVQVELAGLLFEPADEPVCNRQVPAAVQERDLCVER
jgi:hypothetical protein